MGCNYLSISKLQWHNHWSLRMDKQFHPTLYDVYNYLSMPRLKVTRVSETWHRISIDTGMVKFGHHICTELVHDSVLNEKVNASRLSHQLIGVLCCNRASRSSHDDVIKWKHFPRNWPFVWGIHRSPVNSPRKGQWRGALMFTLICARINGWVNNR